MVRCTGLLECKLQGACGDTTIYRSGDLTYRPYYRTRDHAEDNLGGKSLSWSGKVKT